MDYLIVKCIAFVFWALRLLFFSSKQGALIHNFILYCIEGLSFPRFGREVPDIPEVGNILRNGRWKSSATIAIIKRNYLLSPAALKCAIENQAGWRSIVGVRRGRKFTQKEFVVPSHIFISPSYECNLSCRGCYANGHKGELSLEIIERVVGEQEELGLFHVIVLGGEPFLRQDIWQVFQRFPRTNFEVFTNGTLLGKTEINKIARLGNVRLGISLDGFQKNTDERRGKGVYEKAVSVLRLCQEARIFYGVSVTCTRNNFYEVTSNEFIATMADLGVFYISYFPYMSFSQNGDRELSLSPEQQEELIQFGDRFRDNHPNNSIFLIVGRNGLDMVTACPAADSRIHITASGDVEPCVFCHFAADNIKNKSILEVMNSEFFRQIRMLNNTGASCFTPCKAAYSLFLRNDFMEIGAYRTT